MAKVCIVYWQAKICAVICKALLGKIGYCSTLVGQTCTS